MAPRTVVIGTQSNGGQARLTSPAAASYKRARAQGLPSGGLTSTTRDWDTQMRWHNEWKAGKRKAYAAHPNTSNHCKGLAVDFGTAQRSWMARLGSVNGWRRTNADEAWHYVYFSHLDKRKNFVVRAPAAVKAAAGTLKRGKKGSKVTALQRGLNRAFPSYSRLKVDGDFGPATEKVVRIFQDRVGLKVDGKVGPVTVNALRRFGVAF